MIEMDMPKLEVLENDDFYAKVVCEPLEEFFSPHCPARRWKESNFSTAA